MVDLDRVKVHCPAKLVSLVVQALRAADVLQHAEVHITDGCIEQVVGDWYGGDDEDDDLEFDPHSLETGDGHYCIATPVEGPVADTAAGVQPPAPVVQQAMEAIAALDSLVPKALRMIGVQASVKRRSIGIACADVAAHVPVEAFCTPVRAGQAAVPMEPPRHVEEDDKEDPWRAVGRSSPLPSAPVLSLSVDALAGGCSGIAQALKSVDGAWCADGAVSRVGDHSVAEQVCAQDVACNNVSNDSVAEQASAQDVVLHGVVDDSVAEKASVQDATMNDVFDDSGAERVQLPCAEFGNPPRVKEIYATVRALGVARLAHDKAAELIDAG